MTLSETMRREILGRGDIEEDAVVVVPNGVDVERFVPGPRDETLAASLGIGSDDPVVGYISGLNAYEGIVYLIRAVALLRDRGRRRKTPHRRRRGGAVQPRRCRARARA